MHRLGTNLRQVYPSLITDVFVRSTDSERTLQSASALLGGLLPDPQPPIPVTVLPMDMDSLVFGHSGCPREKQVADQFRREQVSKIYDWYAPTHRQIESILGKTVDDMYRGLYYTDNLRPRRCHQRPPIQTPRGRITDAMLDTTDTFFNIQNRLTHCSSHEATRLRIGGFLLEVKRNLLRQIAATPTPKLLIFSAHDVSISALLGGLQSPDLK